MKTFLNVLLVALFAIFVSGCAGAATQPAATPEATPATESPSAEAVSTPADAIRGDWQGTPLTERALRERMNRAGWDGLVDYVSEDVDGYGPVSRLIFGGNTEEQALALEKAEAIRAEFNGVLWYVYGVVGSGEECGWKTPQTGLNLLRIEVYSTGSFLPETTSCRQAPG